MHQHVLGYRFGALAAGAGGLILADIYSYSFVYTIMSIIMILGVATTLLTDEPSVDLKTYTLRESIIEPFKEFFTRYEVINSNMKLMTPYLILLFILSIIFLINLSSL